MPHSAVGRSEADDLPAVSARPPSRTLEVLAALSAGLLSLLVVIVALQLWRADLDVPLYPEGDTPYLLMLARNIEWTGWFQTTPALNFPFGQDLHGFPLSAADTLHLLVVKALLLLFDAQGALNVYFIVGFPLIAVSSHVALRRLGFRPMTALVMAVLYSLAPYHFERSQWHLFLSSYFVVPWACLLVLRTLQGELPGFTRRDWRPWLAGAVLVALIASTGIYYAAFTIILMTAAAVIRAAQGGTWRALAAPALAAGGIVGTVVLQALPNLLHRATGSGAEITGRIYAGSEYYGLKIDHLVLPSRFHRVELLGSAARHTFESPIAGEGGDHLGLVAAVGAMAAVLSVILGRRRHSPLLRACGVLILVAILVGTVAGLSGVLAAVGFTAIRAWSRIAVFISFFSLVSAAVLWQRVSAQIHGVGAASRARIYRATLAVSLLALAVLDQTGPSFVPSYRADQMKWRADGAYFDKVKAALGEGAAVFQLPYTEFPEGSTAAEEVSPYDQLLGYLHTTSLRWSGGGVRGETTEWQPAALNAGLPAALPRIRAVGFAAVQVDRLAYRDGAESVESVLRTVTSSPPLEDSSGRWVTYLLQGNLGPAPARRAAAERQILDPVQLVPGPELFAGAPAADALLETVEQRSTFGLLNESEVDRQVSIRGIVSLDVPGSVSLRTDDRRIAVTRLSPTEFAIEDQISVAPGSTLIELTVTPRDPGPAPVPRRVSTRIRNLHADDEALLAALE